MKINGEFMHKTIHIFLIILFVGFFSGSSCVNNVFGDSFDSKFVLFSLVGAKNNQLITDQGWSRGLKAKDVKFSTPKGGTQIEVDIINCAGYLASAKMEYDSTYGWQVQVIPESTASDLTEKLRQCDLEPDSKYAASKAFAVTPRNEKRKTIKLENPNLEKVFSSLPLSVQSWAKQFPSRKTMALSLKSLDDWADTDGDGEIDLVQINGLCVDSDEYICSRVLRKIYGVWTEIAYTMPA
jgi:hypothetical protein